MGMVKSAGYSRFCGDGGDSMVVDASFDCFLVWFGEVELGWWILRVSRRG